MTIDDIEHANYHSDNEYLTRCQLALSIESLELYDAIFQKHTLPPKIPTRPMEHGTIGHAILLDGRNIDDIVSLYPSDCLDINGNLIGKHAKKFRESISPVIAMKEQEYEDIEASVKAIRSGKFGPVLEAMTHHEHLFRGVVHGRKCKCRIDLGCEMDGYFVVYDLKIGVIANDQFRRNARTLMYWLQLAHYSKVITAETGLPVEFRFVVLEPTAPYRVRIYHYDDISKESMFSSHEYHLRRLIAAEESGIFVDPLPEPLTVEAWDPGIIRAAGEELEFDGVDDEGVDF